MSRTSDQFAEINVTTWPAVGDEQLGTKPKRWLMHPTTRERWLLKYVTYSTRNDGSKYQKGDDWAERIANDVALKLGLPAAHTELAVELSGGDSRLGIISKSVLAVPDVAGTSTEELVPGNELLAAPVTAGARDRYTVDAVEHALRAVQPSEDSPQGFTAWDVFVGFLVLDALIGNTDRHEENWAAVANSSERRLAPTFDHASSLGFLLSDEQRQQRLASADLGFTPEGFADRAKSQFAGRPHPIEVAMDALSRCSADVRDHWLNQCSDADGLAEAVALVPRHRMSAVAQQFAERVLRRNIARLLGARR